jgi:L-ascorbate metabolism protein UlaG (beta-lactamase superfamily)
MLSLALPHLACAARLQPAVRGLPVDEPHAAVSAVWVGHATVLLRIGRRTVLLDPNLSNELLLLQRTTPASLTPEDLPPIDVALLSHMHLDHFDAKTLRALGSRPAVFFPAGGEPYADEIVQQRKEGLAPWQSVEVAGLTITAVPARHQGGRYGIDALWNHAYTGWVIEGLGRRVYFAGDTGWDPEMFKEIGRRFPGIDLAFIPIAPSREASTRDRWGHVGPHQALDVFRDVGARAMVPIHFEAYFSPGDPSAPRRRFLAAVHERGLDGRVACLRTGERVVLDERDHALHVIGAEAPERREALR